MNMLKGKSVKNISANNIRKDCYPSLTDGWSIYIGAVEW